MKRKKLYIIDGNSYCYRAFYAIGDLRTSDGRPTGAVFGFINMLNKLRNDQEPDYLAVCFDLKGPTLRHEKYEEYKIHRKPMPDDLQPQMGIIKEVVGAYGIPIFGLKGYEADDIIATLAVQFKEKVDVYIASGDKDMLQLVDKYVKVYNPQGERSIVDANGVYERFNVYPSQITDLLALTGDSSDNIPGVPGIGPKTAAELLNNFGDLEKILPNTEKIPQKKRRELLEEFAQQARLSKELATVMIDAPVDTDLEKLKGAGQDVQALKVIFKDLEFRNHYRTLAQMTPQEELKVKTNHIAQKSQLIKLSKELKSAGKFSFSIVPQEDELSSELFSLQISKTDDEIFIVNVSGKLKKTDIQEILGPVFSDKKIIKIGYDLKKAYEFLAGCEICLDGPFFDIMIGAYLLDPQTGTRVLSDIAANYIGRNVDVRMIACEQLLLKKALETQLKEKNLYQLFSDVEMPLVRVLASMEQVGIKVDKNFLETLNLQMDEKLESLTKQIHKISGAEFNINSPKQLAEILFEKLKLPVIKKGKSGPSTNVEVLTRLSHEHELPVLILEYREVTKLKSTYVVGLLELISTDTHRIHTSFNQAVTATGRLSSSAPNLQNIPIRTQSGKQVRKVFISQDKKWSLLCADYSQIELRVLAHLAKDKTLIKAFKEGRDIHSFTASLIFNEKESNVSKKMRDLAKRVNFGIIYGMGAYGLARDIGVSNKEAKEFIAQYFKRYSSVKKYLDSQIEFARDKGYVTTLLNRRRYIPQINARDAMQKSFAERMAMNTPIQGTAADLIKIAMIDIYNALEKQKTQARMVLQVHDELVFDVPDNEIETVRRIVSEKMEHVLKLSVPITVDIKIGKNWKDLKKL